MRFWSRTCGEPAPYRSSRPISSNSPTGSPIPTSARPTTPGTSHEPPAGPAAGLPPWWRPASSRWRSEPIPADRSASLPLIAALSALKPSHGAVSTEGVFPLSWSLDHAGPLARSVRDAAALLQGLTGQALAFAETPIEGLRIGLVAAHLDSASVTPGVRETVAAALDRLGRCGAILSTVVIPELDAVNRGLMTLASPEAALIHEGTPGGSPPRLRAGNARPARSRRKGERHRLCPGPTPPHPPETGRRDAVRGSRRPAQPRGGLRGTGAGTRPSTTRDGDGEMLSSGLANMTGHPALSLPCGLSAGLPVGLQLIGPSGRDADLLAAAAAVERCLDIRAKPAL